MERARESDRKGRKEGKVMVVKKGGNVREGTRVHVTRLRERLMMK